MKLFSPLEVVPGVYQLRAIGARVTALLNDDGVVLVDAGGRGSPRLIAAGLRAVDSSMDRVRLVVLTHYHPDHVGGLANLVKAASAKVAAHQQESGILNGKDQVPSPFHNPILAKATQPFMSLLYGRPVQVDYPLKDGDTLPMAEDIHLIHTPGHTPGSMCLYLASKKVLIVGDALEYRSQKLSPPARSFTHDFMQARESLKKLLALDFDIMCFSHFPPLRRDARNTLRRLVESFDS